MKNATKTETIYKTIAELKPEDVRSVYSGRNGACCCGCAGKHRYNSAWKKEATEDRGYAISKGEINDSQIRKTLSIIQENFQTADVFPEDKMNIASVVRGERLHIIYLRDGIAIRKMTTIERYREELTNVVGYFADAHKSHSDSSDCVYCAAIGSARQLLNDVR